MTTKFDPLQVMDEHDPDTDSFTTEPPPGEQGPYHQENGQYQTKHQKEHEQDCK